MTRLTDRELWIGALEHRVRIEISWSTPSGRPERTCGCWAGTRSSRRNRFCRTVDPRVRVFIHSDGNVLSVMDDLVFDLGIDTINPMQPERMDLSRVKKEYGARIVMCGCGSLQRTLPFGSVEDVRSEVRAIIDRYGENGGLVIMPSNVVETNVPVENVAAFLETARDYFPY